MIRLKDIAEMAQVSIGTVDRVIHNRGRVSSASKKKVMKILEANNYRPNIIAKTLSAGKTIKISALLPDPSLSAYWIKPVQGINRAASQLSQFGAEVHTFFFDPYHASSFQQQAERVVESDPDGILLAPILHQEALDFSEICRDHKIPLICFNTYINLLNPLSFIGQDLHASGRLAAELMAMCQSPGTILIIHIGEKAGNSLHIHKKEEGFRELIKQQDGAPVNVVTIQLSSPATQNFEEKLDQTFKKHQDAQGIFVTTSKANHIAHYLEKTGKTNLRLIGYDLTEENIPYLQRGTIDMLIHQNAEKQSFLGITYLVDHLVFRKAIPPMKHLPLSIITKENLSSYLQSDLD